MTKRDFQSGADRSNKLAKDRGFPGQTFGAAGRVRHIDPSSTPNPEPTHRKIDLAYARYAAKMRRDGRMPLPPALWLKPKNDPIAPRKTRAQSPNAAHPRKPGPAPHRHSR